MARLTTSDFERIHALSRSRAHLYDIETGTALFRSQFPTQEDADAFEAWDVERDYQELMNEEPITPTADEIRGKIRDIDFRNEDEVAVLNAMLSTGSHYFIGLGYSSGVNGEKYGYALAPCPRLLEVTKETNWHDSRLIYPSCILGLNKRAEPMADPRAIGSSGENQLRSSHESGRSKDTNRGNDKCGFVFYQLGRLDYTPGWNGSSHGANDREWYDTGYVVVVMINEDGSAGWVYALYNFYPEDENGERSRVNDSQWGYLPGQSLRRAGVALAPSFQDLQPENALSLPDSRNRGVGLVVGEEDIAEEFELVSAVSDESNPGRIIRQYVVGNAGSARERR